jgi:hypothetical protein
MKLPDGAVQLHRLQSGAWRALLPLHGVTFEAATVEELVAQVRAKLGVNGANGHDRRDLFAERWQPSLK